MVGLVGLVGLVGIDVKSQPKARIGKRPEQSLNEDLLVRSPGLVLVCLAHLSWFEGDVNCGWTIGKRKMGGSVGKVSQNIDPFKNHFLSLIINTGLGQVHHSHF